MEQQFFQPCDDTVFTKGVVEPGATDKPVVAPCALDGQTQEVDNGVYNLHAAAPGADKDHVKERLLVVGTLWEPSLHKVWAPPTVGPQAIDVGCVAFFEVQFLSFGD